MRTEAKRSFRHGFVLNETELRRFRETISGQMDQACPDGNYQTKYEVKFRNGAISEPVEIEEILNLENHGSGRITRLMVRAQGSNPDETYVEIKFTDPSSEGEGSDRPLEYRVGGENKDWVFVTSSKIEERISKVSAFRLVRLIENKLMLPLVLISCTMLSIIVMSYLQYTDTEYLNKLHEIQNSTRDPVKAIIDTSYP